jgi:5-deoxy-glucuronate isomerase
VSAARRHRTASGSEWETEVRVGRDLAWTGLAIGGGGRRFAADGLERLVLPLEGGASVIAGGVHHELRGRDSVFDGPADALYVPAGTELELVSAGRVAIASAPGSGGAVQLVRREDVPIEERGAGLAARLVRNVGIPGVLDASRLIVCEVLTPAGAWSSYPAHKHDVERPGEESQLEEIYHFAARSRPPAEAVEPFALFSCGGVDLDDEVAFVVRDGDTVLVPAGYHGPAAAPPDVDLYYLNVMAGPGPERVWLIADDPRQTAARAAWTERSRS